ncbi:hypothetical protein GCM10023160_14820 [Brachybacterium paraconglomeratum]
MAVLSTCAVLWIEARSGTFSPAPITALRVHGPEVDGRGPEGDAMAAAISQMGTKRRRLLRGRRAVGVLATGLVLFSLGACDALPALPGSGSAAPEAPSAVAAPMDPEQVSNAASTATDTSWLCRPGEAQSPLPTSSDGGMLTPETVSADGNDLTISGPFRLAADHSYTGFVPEGVLLPAAPENRGIPAPGFDGELGVEGAQAPPMVVRERVEVAAEEGAPAPSAATAHLTLGTCDDAPLPDGQFLLRLSGGGIEGPGRGKDDAGWRADGDVLVDVVDGRLRAVPGAISAPSGEVPVDLSSLACRAALEAVGDGDGLTVSVEQPTARVSSQVPEDELGPAITAKVTVTAQELGTRALLQGVVVVNPSTGTVVSGARNASDVPLQWIDADGVSRTDSAGVSRSTCSRGALSPGSYRAHGFAVTVDAEGATHLVLSDPWKVEVVDEEPAA